MLKIDHARPDSYSVAEELVNTRRPPLVVSLGVVSRGRARPVYWGLYEGGGPPPETETAEGEDTFQTRAVDPTSFVGRNFISQQVNITEDSHISPCPGLFNHQFFFTVKRPRGVFPAGRPQEWCRPIYVGLPYDNRVTRSDLTTCLPTAGWILTVGNDYIYVLSWPDLSSDEGVLELWKTQGDVSAKEVPTGFSFVRAREMFPFPAFIFARVVED